ncbi:MAG TPA: sodium:solute symporter family protein, partial [Vicinamibacterales bacterium]|nr:sodium:solute symporter family protein [Vicinamibacterales bacterium]
MPHASGSVVHLALLIAYSGLLVAIGLWIGRRVRSTADFFVAGRRLGPGLLFSTLLAANIGAGSTVGAAGLGYRDGLSAWWWVGSAGLGSLVLAWTVGPAIRRVAAAHDLRTVGDFLEWRYGPAVRAVVAALLWVGTLAILAGQLLALAWVLEVVAGIPKAAGCLIGGLVMTTYFTAGGLLTAAAVNLVQLVVLLGGFAIALPLLLGDVGGLARLRDLTPRADYWSFWAGGGSGWTYAAMLAPSFIVSPGLLQKIYGARDDRTVRTGVALNAAVLLLFAFVPVLAGMIARVRHPGLSNHELALPTLLMADLPAAIGALGLAALFSAEVSTCDAILFMLSTSLSQDLYRRFVAPQASDAQVMKVARAAAMAGGALGVGLALVSSTIIAALSIFYTLLTVTLFLPLVAGLYTRRPGRAAALAAIGGGVIGMMAARGPGVG